MQPPSIVLLAAESPKRRRPSAEPGGVRDHQRLLVLLLPRPLDVKLLFLAPKLRRSLSLELVPVDRQGVVDGDNVIHELPYRGERQLPVLELHIFQFLILLVRPVHRPVKIVPVLLDR